MDPFLISRASPAAATGCECADSQTEGVRFQSRECAARVPTDLSRDSTDARRPDQTLRADAPGARRSGTSRVSRPRAHDDASASQVFLDCLLQDVTVEREVGDEPFEAIVFVVQLPQPPELAYTEVAVCLLPHVERRLAHAELTAHVRDGRPTLGLPEGLRHLLLAELRSLHRPASRKMGGSDATNLL
jgi:hypothetical protein